MLSGASVSAEETVVIVPSRAGVQIPYLLTAPTGGRPRLAFVLLSGGSGEHNLRQRGEVVQVFNDQRLPARSRKLFAAEDDVAVLLDVPSDRNLLSQDFRVSEAHVEDVLAVLADVRQRFPGVPIVLVGHSNGTLSAAHVGLRAAGLLDRVVLISGRLVAHWYGGPGLSGFDFQRLNVPLLLVHHVRDDCTVTPYAGAVALAERYPLISVSGPPGLTKAACASLGPHGLEGREAAVVEAIRAWASDQPWPREIN